MELTNGEIYAAVPALDTLFDKEMPVEISISLVDMMSELDGPFKKIDQIKNSLVKKHGVSDKMGQAIVRPNDKNWPEFVKEYAVLMSKKIKLKLVKIDIPRESNGNPLIITPNAVRALTKLIHIAKSENIKDMAEEPTKEDR